MSRLSLLIADIVSLLDESGFCSDTQILETSYFSTEQYAIKIRTKIFSLFHFQIRVYCNQQHCDYSYQVFDEEPLWRWDNAEHYPELTTFPHHFHARDGNIQESSLVGDPVEDLKMVLREVKSLIQELEKS